MPALGHVVTNADYDFLPGSSGEWGAPGPVVMWSWDACSEGGRCAILAYELSMSKRVAHNPLICKDRPCVAHLVGMFGNLGYARVALGLGAGVCE